jgi:hypothetical protein
MKIMIMKKNVHEIEILYSHVHVQQLQTVVVKQYFVKCDALVILGNMINSFDISRFDTVIDISRGKNSIHVDKPCNILK